MYDHSFGGVSSSPTGHDVSATLTFKLLDFAPGTKANLHLYQAIFVDAEEAQQAFDPRWYVIGILVHTLAFRHTDIAQH
ncbi:MAG: hypothetical protein ACR2PA_18975 [Hyphomicrobiaceae bacterium]